MFNSALLSKGKGTGRPEGRGRDLGSSCNPTPKLKECKKKNTKKTEASMTYKIVMSEHVLRQS